MITAVILAATMSTSTVATSRGDQTMVVYPPSARASEGHRDTGKPLVLILSGEGGWRAFDVLLAGWLSDAGYWVGGIDCMKYFWKPQDDRAALASDIAQYARALAKLSGSPDKARVVLAGYSFGADLAPWIAGAPNRDKTIAALLMIGPDLQGSLEARVSEIIGFAAKNHVFDTRSALADCKATPVLLIHGGSDKNSEAPALAESFAGKKKLLVVPGATHHFAGHEDELKNAIIGGLSQLLSP